MCVWWTASQAYALDAITGATEMTEMIKIEIDRLEKENELLQKELKKHLIYQEHRHGRIGTHDPICYEYGPRHYECALREIERLRDALQKIKKRNPFHNVSPPMDKQYYAQIITEMVGIANAALKEET